MRFDLLEGERKAVEEAGGRAQPGLQPISITPEQVIALHHAAHTEDFYLVGLAPLEDVQLDQEQTLNRTLVIEAYDDKGWILLTYAWNVDGQGAWLDPSGGWHYGPGESGYKPWADTL